MLEVRPGGAAARAGLQRDDVITSVNGAKIASSTQVVEILQPLKGGAEADIVFQRDGKENNLKIKLDPQPLEALEHSAVTYDFVKLPKGERLRTIITEPKASKGKSPAFLFIQGLACASIDRPSMPEAPDTKLVHAMAQAGFVTMRVDKPGLGDSEGPPCGTIDFQTELAGYVAALKQLKTLPSVDPERVYLFGHSMGGVMAPYVAKAVPARGAIVYGTLVRTWMEYLLENTRRQALLSGASEEEVSRMVLEQTRLVAPVLIDGKTVEQVWKDHPERKFDDPTYEPERIYGRHVRFFQQLQELNLSQAWKQADVAVLAIHGEYDWVSPQEDHELIAKIASAQPRGKPSRFLSLPQADHGFTLHDTLAASLSAMGRGRWAEELPKAVLGWIREVEATQPANETRPTTPANTANKDQARAPGFPSSWIGRWKGEMTVLGGDDGARAPGFSMELVIAPTEKPDRYQWTIIYDGLAGRQQRNYTLVVQDAARGEFLIDENNGIVLPARELGGVLHSSFVVAGNRIHSREQLRDPGTSSAQIEVELLTIAEQGPRTSGGDGVPEVKAWSPRSVQRGVLKPVNAKIS